MYCYESGDGFITHVASRRRIGEIPERPDILTASYDEYSEAYRKHMDAVDKAELVNIGLPYDGKTFNDPDLKSFLERVKYLKDVGYNVPNYVLERIEKEIEDEYDQQLAKSREERPL